MASFKEFCQTLLLYYDASLISDEDFIILHELFSSPNPDFAYDAYNRFDLDGMNDDEFRVRKCHKYETSFICCRNKIQLTI